MPNMKVRPMTISAMRRKSRRFASDIFPSPMVDSLPRERARRSANEQRDAGGVSLVMPANHAGSFSALFL
jgi:hypothetical protein